MLCPASFIQNDKGLPDTLLLPMNYVDISKTKKEWDHIATKPALTFKFLNFYRTYKPERTFGHILKMESCLLVKNFQIMFLELKTSSFWGIWFLWSGHWESLA